MNAVTKKCFEAIKVAERIEAEFNEALRRSDEHERV